MRGDEYLDRRFLRWFVRRADPWFALVWLPALLVAPVAAAIRGPDRPLGVGLTLLAAGYVASTLLAGSDRRPRWTAEAVVAALTVLAAALLIRRPQEAPFLFPLLGMAMALGVRRRVAPSLVASLAISATVTTALSQSLRAGLIVGFATVMAGASTFLLTSLARAFSDLDASRLQLAEAAVAADRARLARDLHDLLGRTLSVVVVKAEAIRRTAADDPRAAVDHAAGIETIGREALSEVRAAVADHGAPTLPAELANAAELLAAAGIDHRIPPAPELARPTEAVLAWVLREAVTNVVRHSRARRCTVALDVDRGEVTIEIFDDGVAAVDPVPRPGEGLRGLRERVEAAGGILVAEASPEGFRLSATVPTREGSP